jgi:hypothetical protein
MLSSLKRSDFGALRSFVSFAGRKKKFLAKAGSIGSSLFLLIEFVRIMGDAARLLKAAPSL